LLRRIPRGGRGRHSQPARPRQPVPERRLPSGDRLPGHAIFAFLRAPTAMQWLRGAVHPHAERAIPVGAHVSERGRVAAWPGGISRALQSALDRPALGVPHARPGSPAASCTWSRCMNTLSSVSNQSGALHSDSTANEPNRKKSLNCFMADLDAIVPLIQACLSNAESLLNSAKEISKPGRNHIAFHVAALALEEIGKAAMLVAHSIRPAGSDEADADDEE